MNRLTRLSVLALVLVLAWPAVPALMYDSEYSFIEPLEPGDCQLASSYVSGVTFPQSTTTEVRLANPTMGLAVDTLIYQVIVDGVPKTLSIPYRLPRMTQMRILITITVPFESQGVQACDNDPGGGTDGPDPVIHVTAGDYVPL